MTRRTFSAVGAVLACATALIACYAAWLPDVSELKSSNPMTTQYVSIYVKRMLRKGDRPSVAMTWVPLDRISPYLRHVVLIAEDDRFYRHKGVDWESFEQAMRYNLRKQRLARGGSTITQQVARNLFLSPSKSPVRKLKEALIARHLERTLGKDRVLEIYLNVAEWGEGVFGAEAASRTYFQKHAAELSPEEAVALAAALPSPYERRPDAPPTEFVRKLRELYMERLRKSGLLAQEEP